MLTVAFLSNQFPSPIETYVVDQLEELNRRGVRVVTGSVRRAVAKAENNTPGCAADVVLLPLRATDMVRAAWLWARRWGRIAPLIARIVFHGNEGFWQRIKAVAHTFLGACYAASLVGRGVGHIHSHHGYFGSWIGMTAARILGVPFSMTLYGSDLLLHGAYLDTKLEHCAFCITISEFNRQYILRNFPGVQREKLEVVRLGVEVSVRAEAAVSRQENRPVTLLAVGRLHPVKDHAFLVRACAELLARKLNFQCFIVGEGPEHVCLEFLIRASGLEGHVHLLGFVSQARRDALYEEADIVVLTSRSEGIPVVLMEAMARGKLVLAPAITGIPELVAEGTGLLYEPGDMDDFVKRILFVQSLLRKQNDPDDSAHPVLDRIRQAAQRHIRQDFDFKRNLDLFGDVFLHRVAQTEVVPDENPVLQQI